MRRHLLLLAVPLVVLAAGCASLPVQKSPSPLSSALDGEIAHYEARLARAPRLTPVYAQLAGAYLRKAQAMLCNHTHRFEEALRWAELALRATPSLGVDGHVRALQVTALLGLGRDGEARELLPGSPEQTDDFHLAAALAQWHRAQGAHDAARHAFLRAAHLAHAGEAPALEAWAEVMAAGTLIDTGRAAQARPHLLRARQLAPGDKELRLHLAEVHAAEGQAGDALALYEALLEEAPDPAISHQAFLLARALGRTERAEHHRAAAEAGYRRPLEAGEVYTLGALARLLVDAGHHLDEALRLARRNLDHVRDRAAHDTLEAVLARTASR